MLAWMIISSSQAKVDNSITPQEEAEFEFSGKGAWIRSQEGQGDTIGGVSVGSKGLEARTEEMVIHSQREKTSSSMESSRISEKGRYLWRTHKDTLKITNF